MNYRRELSEKLSKVTRDSCLNDELHRVVRCGVFLGHRSSINDSSSKLTGGNLKHIFNQQKYVKGNTSKSHYTIWSLRAKYWGS